MSLNDHLVAMSETQPWTSFALRGLNFQFLELNFQFFEGNFKMSEPCVILRAKFKDPHEADSMDNLQPVCTPCHRAKTKTDLKVLRRVR